MSQVEIVQALDEGECRGPLSCGKTGWVINPEFRNFFARVFDLERVGLAALGYLRAPSGMAYAVVFLGRSGEPFPAGVELFALPAALEPLDNAAVDKDLWAILGWMIDGVGPPWSRADLEVTGRLYRIPATG